MPFSSIASKLKKNSRLLATLAFILLLLAIVQFTGIRQQFTLSYIQSVFQTHWFAGLAVFALLFSLGNLIQVPGWIFLASAVIALGKLEGGIVTYIAALTSCCISYGFIFLLGGDALRKLDSPFAKKMLAKLDKSPLLAIFLLRTVFQTAPPLNYTLALSGVSFRYYLLGTILGLPLPIALYCLFFDYLKQFIGIVG